MFDYVMGGTFQPDELVLFICACVILVSGNICGLVAIQMAFTAPIFTYFLVFAYPAPSFGEAILGIFGILLVISAGVLLSRRQAHVHRIKLPPRENVTS